MRALQRFPNALSRRLRGPYAALARLDLRLSEIELRLGSIERALGPVSEAAGATRDMISGELSELVSETHGLVQGELRGALRSILFEDAENRRRLHRVRRDSDYALAWSEQRPLISVTVATVGRAELLASRSLPAILGQSYDRLELVVVGDHADEATEEAVRSFGDSRVVYRNLTQRLRFADPQARWLVGSTMARNEANRLARGRWILSVDDDDAIRPDCLERLLGAAREGRLEAVYGRVLVHGTGERPFELGAFPPEQGRFTWAAGMFHGGLRCFERELSGATLGLPGDWFLAERMLRAGVRFGMVDELLGDIYPSPMNGVAAPPGEGAGTR